MGSKLLVSIDGLSLQNLNTVISSRSIDEVIVVNTSSGFNSLSTSALNTVKTIKSGLPSGTSLSVAFANESSASLDDDFYDFLNTNSINFFNDSELVSLTDGLVLESSSVSGSNIASSGSNLSTFNKSSLNQNNLYTSSGDLDLGSNFGTKPSITLSSPSYLSDLSDTISVTISAAQFASLLSSNTASNNIVAIDNTSNITVGSSSSTAGLTPNDGDSYRFLSSQIQDDYNGSNRFGNLSSYSDTRSTSGTTLNSSSSYVSIWWGDEQNITLTASQALRIPLMGIVPNSAFTVTLADNAQSLSAAINTFTDGQIASFNGISFAY